MDRYLQGESIKLKINLKDKSLKVPIDISDLELLNVKVYHAGNGTTLKEGTYSGGEVISTTPADGVIFFPIEDDLTGSLTAGVYKVEVTIRTSDTHFDDNDLTQKQEQRAFKVVSKGIMKRDNYTEMTMYFAIGTDYYVDEDIYVDEDLNI